MSFEEALDAAIRSATSKRLDEIAQAIIPGSGEGGVIPLPRKPKLAPSYLKTTGVT